MLKKKLMLMVIIVITLVLETSPFGVVMFFTRVNMAGAVEKTNRSTYSYFDLLPFGNAHFGLFLTAMLSVLLLMVITIYCITSKGAKLIKRLAIAALICALMPLMYGISYMSIIGVCIIFLFIIDCLDFKSK